MFDTAVKECYDGFIAEAVRQLNNLYFLEDFFHEQRYS